MSVVDFWGETSEPVENDWLAELRDMPFDELRESLIKGLIRAGCKRDTIMKAMCASPNKITRLRGEVFADA